MSPETHLRDSQERLSELSVRKSGLNISWQQIIIGFVQIVIIVGTMSMAYQRVNDRLDAHDKVLANLLERVSDQELHGHPDHENRIKRVEDSGYDDKIKDLVGSIKLLQQSLEQSAQATNRNFDAIGLNIRDLTTRAASDHDILIRATSNPDSAKNTAR